MENKLSPTGEKLEKLFLEKRHKFSSLQLSHNFNLVVAATLDDIKIYVPSSDRCCPLGFCLLSEKAAKGRMWANLAEVVEGVTEEYFDSFWHGFDYSISREYAQHPQGSLDGLIFREKYWSPLTP